MNIKIFRLLTILSMLLSLLVVLEATSSSKAAGQLCKEKDGFKICVDEYYCIGMVCSGVSTYDLAKWGWEACSDVDKALKGLKKLIDDVKQGKINQQQLKSSLRIALLYQDKLLKILGKIVEKCREGIWIYCYDQGKGAYWCKEKCKEGFLAYTCSLYPNSIFLCTYKGDFCKEQDKERIVLHELTHLGGATDDDEKDPINAYALDSMIIPALANYFSKPTGGDPPIYKSIQVFPTPENALGQDLNGDGDTLDLVLRYRNLDTGEVTSTGLLVSSLHNDIDIYENIIAFVDWISRSIRYYDINTGSVGDIGIPGATPSIHKNIIAFFSRGTIHYYDLSTGTLTDTNLAGYSPSIYGDWIAFSSRPSFTIKLYDLRSGIVTDTGAIGANPSLYEDGIAFETRESYVEKDLNSDGDIDDVVIRYYDLTTQTVINTGAVGQFPALYKDRIAFATPEENVNQDLNDDGKIQGSVIHYYDLATSQLVNTKELGTEPDIYEDIISFYLWERWADMDLNGDGDQTDPIVQIYIIPRDAKLGVGAGYHSGGQRANECQGSRWLGFDALYRIFQTRSLTSRTR